MKNPLQMPIILLMLASAIVFRIHIWKIRKNYNKFLIKQQEQENEEVPDLNNIINNLYKLFEIQEQNQLNYFFLILLTLIIIITIKGGFI